MSKQGDIEIKDMKNGCKSNSVPLTSVGDLKRVLKHFSDNTPIEFFMGDCESWTDKYTLSIETNMYEDIDEGTTVNDNPLYLALAVGNLALLDYIRSDNPELPWIEDVKDFIINKRGKRNEKIY